MARSTGERAGKTDVPSTRSRPLTAAAAVAVLLGILTILSGGMVLFGGATVRAAAGDAVPFVLWFNFLSGFVYVIAGIGMFMRRRWALMLATGLAIAIATVFALLGLHIYQDGSFEMRTVAAMSLRLLVWLAIAAVAAQHLTPKGSRKG